MSPKRRDSGPSVVFLTCHMMQGYGVGVVVYQIAQRLIHRGISTTILTLKTDGTYPDLSIHVVDGSLKSTHDALSRLKPDLIIAHTSPFFEQLPQLKHIAPVYAWEHGDPTPDFFPIDGLERRKIKDRKTLEVYARLDGVIAISEFIAEDIGWHKALIIRNGADHLPDPGPKTASDLPAGTERKLRIGTLMRLGMGESLYKGNSLFIELAHSLPDEHFECLAMGRGTEEDALALKDAGIETVRNASEEQKIAYLRSLDIFVSLSLWEGFNLPLAEAASLGTCALAFDTGAHPEVTPWVFSNLAQLRSFIFRCRANPAHLHMASLISYRYVRQHLTWDEAVERFLGVANQHLRVNKTEILARSLNSRIQSSRQREYKSAHPHYFVAPFVWLLRFFSGLRWGNAASKLLPAGDLEVSNGVFISRAQDPQLRLPLRSYLSGYYILIVHVRTSRARGYAKLYVDEGSGFSEDMCFGLVTKKNGPVFRIVWLPHGAKSIRFDPTEEVGELDIPVFHFYRVPRFFARRRILRRISFKHLFLADQSRKTILNTASATAEVHGVDKDEVLFQLYDETFQQPATSGTYANWIERIEEPSHVEILSRPLSKEIEWPLISVLLPTHETDPEHLEACLRSVLGQSYSHFELYVLDDASRSPEVRRVLERFQASDPRLKLHFHTENGHTCHATNDALRLASGQYVALFDHNDLLATHALRRIAEAIVEHPEAVLFYGDEDKLSENGFRKNPHFKPRFNPDLLLAQNYIGHTLVARTSAVREIGGLRPGYEGSQKHDLLLRLTEKLTSSQVVHIPHILYHRRENESSPVLHPSKRSDAAEAGLLAVTDALVRRGEENATAEPAPHILHGYRVRWPIPKEPPLVSLLIPTRDALKLISQCVGSVLAKTTYPRFEIIILDNGSVEKETLTYFEQLRSEPKVRIIRDDRPFNFSALNNAGAHQAQGTILGLINNDIEVIDGDWLTEMVGHALRPNVGCVGAKLLYPDNTIQHAGVITGIGGVAGHAHKRFPKDHPGYFNRLQLTQAVSAVTAACLLVKKSTYEEVGGFDEELAVAFNDVDFCLKVREAGYQNIFTPYAVLYHHESATRGRETTPKRRLRFQQEVATMKARWGHTLLADPYYHPHLSLEYEDFSIGIQTVREIPQLGAKPLK